MSSHVFPDTLNLPTEFLEDTEVQLDVAFDVQGLTEAMSQPDFEPCARDTT
jgi:hypothetical protein